MNYPPSSSTDTPFTPQKKKLRIGWWIAGVFVLLFALFLYQLVGPSPRIVVSKQTTYITEPLVESGLPDYEAYVRNKLREGVTPENNAAVLLMKALGPGDLSAADYAAVAREIGLDDADVNTRVLEPSYGDANRKRITAWLPKPKPSDDELEPEPDVDAIIGAAQNAAWTTAVLPPLAEWVAENKGPLDLIVEATRRPRYYSPSPELLNNKQDMLLSMSLASIQSSREAARGLALRAHWYVGENRLDEAWQDNLAMYRLSALVAQGSTLVEQLVAMAIRGIAVHTTNVILSSDELTKEVARQIQRDLTALPPFRGTAKCIDEGERIFGLNATIESRSHGLGAISQLSGANSEPSKLGIVSMDWNVILRELNRTYDQAVAALRIEGFEERTAAFRQFEAELNSMASKVKQPDRLLRAVFSRHARSEVVANIFTSLLLPALTASNAAEDRTNSLQSLTQLAAALAVYRAEHGAYPAQLDDLVPGILTTLPTDLYHAKPFVYQRLDGGYLLYTIGVNDTDDGGSNEQLSIVEGRQIDSDDPAAENLREKIPAGSDDFSIRLPIPPFELPKAAE